MNELFLKTDSQLLFLIQWNGHVEKNMFSCSLSCTLITIKDCSFYDFESLSWDVSLRHIAKLVVAWLYRHFDKTSRQMTLSRPNIGHASLGTDCAAKCYRIMLRWVFSKPKARGICMVQTYTQNINTKGTERHWIARLSLIDPPRQCYCFRLGFRWTNMV